MYLLSNVLTYMRRYIKLPQTDVISDSLLVDYVNRFVTSDMPAQVQLFDLKTTYQFLTYPGIDQYNMPLYDVQTELGDEPISWYPVYQGFQEPAYVNGYPLSFTTQRSLFKNTWPNYLQSLPVAATGDGSTTEFQINLPFTPNLPNTPSYQTSGILRGHVDTTGIIATGNNQDPPLRGDSPVTFDTSIPVTSVNPAVFLTSYDSNNKPIIVTDSGQFLDENFAYGLLMQPGKAPLGNASLSAYSGETDVYSTEFNTVNYLTGVANVNFPTAPADGAAIQAACYYWQLGIPRTINFYNNVLTLRSPPARQYNIEVTAYLTPAAFLNLSTSLPFAYMSEYIALGAARKLLYETGDWEQFKMYESIFNEQKRLVQVRAERQWTSTRTQTIFSAPRNIGFGFGYNSSLGNQ